MTRRDTHIGLIEAADHRLLTLHNEMAMAEYEQARDGADRWAQLRHIAEETRTLLEAPALAEAVAGCLESSEQGADERARRKAVLLEREVRSSRIECAPEVVRALEAVRRTLAPLDISRFFSTLARDPDRASRREALAQLAKAGETAEPAIRAWARAANARARETGHADYAEAKLAYEGLTADGLCEVFRRWAEARKESWRELVQSACSANEGIEAWDVLYAYEQQAGPLSRSDLTGGPVEQATALLSMLDVQLDALPVRIEERDVPFNGACFRIAPGSDVRVLLRRGLHGTAALSYMLHEFGHAIYYCHCPAGTQLLIDPHLAREVLADLWTHFLELEPFLRRATAATSRAAHGWIRARRCREAVAVLLYVRDSLFTLEVLRDPETPFADSWRRVSREWLGINDASGAYELFDFQNPLDMKSYVFAKVLSRNLFTRLVMPLLAGRANEVVPLLRDTLYRPGHTLNWQQKLDLDGAS